MVRAYRGIRNEQDTGGGKCDRAGARAFVMKLTAMHDLVPAVRAALRDERPSHTPPAGVTTGGPVMPFPSSSDVMPPQAIEADGPERLRLPSMTALNPSFAKLGVRDEIVRALAENGIEHTFAIQELTLPLALAGG